MSAANEAAHRDLGTKHVCCMNRKLEEKCSCNSVFLPEPSLRICYRALTPALQLPFHFHPENVLQTMPGDKHGFTRSLSLFHKHADGSPFLSCALNVFLAALNDTWEDVNGSSEGSCAFIVQIIPKQSSKTHNCLSKNCLKHEF